MNSFTIELVSNPIWIVIRVKVFVLLQNSTRANTFEKRMAGCHFRKIIPFFAQKCYCLYQKFTFSDGRESPGEKRKVEPMQIEPGFYPSFIDIVVAMNNKTRGRLDAQSFQYNGIYVSVDKITPKIVHLPEYQSVFIVQIADLSHVFGCDLEQNQTGVNMKGKGSQYPQYSHDIKWKHSLMIYIDIIEYNIVGDAKTPIVRCIPFISKVKRYNFYRTVHELSILPKFTI